MKPDDDPIPDEDRTVSALLLTDVCMTSPLEQDVDAVKAAVAGWSRGQRLDAFEWAWYEHLEAGDNDVDRLPCPPHVQVLR